MAQSMRLKMREHIRGLPIEIDGAKVSVVLNPAVSSIALIS